MNILKINIKINFLYNDMDLSIIIPTYNEKENIQILINKLFQILKQNKIKGEIIIVDDNSPDRTSEAVRKIKNPNLRLIKRKGKLGLSSAVIEGFNASMGKIIGVMDADLSHHPEKIPEMFNLIKNNQADLVIGSRYIKGGKILNWNIKRKILSRGATILAGLFTKVKDPMSGFFMIKKSCLPIEKLNSKGFKILLEIIIKSNCKNIKEIPITFTNRTKGKSKANIKEITLYLKNLASYISYKRAHIQFMKFAFVGFIGTIINLLILYTFTEFFGIYYLLSAIFAFLIAATNNYILNKIWTFNEKIKQNFISKYIKFLSVSIFALVFNLIFLYIFTELAGIYYLISQVLAIGIVLIINFLGNKIWIFK